jgi:LmbE family N-acetylglucosaminyl deacetylase
MAVPDFPDATTLVMAHPDDEVLWASSVLARMERIVLCFEDVASFPAWGEGRRRSLAAFPLPAVTGLGLRESEALNGAAWPDPVATDYGLAVRRRPGCLPGFSEARYRETYARLVDGLRPLLAGARSVLTHNPWGEYGHEDHVQVFRAVAALQREIGFAIRVPGYVSPKSYGLMLRCLPQFDCGAPPLPTDPALGARLQALYTANGCWTWFDDYAWPARESFYRLLGPGEAPVPPRGGHLLNMIWIDPPPPRPPLARRIAHRIGRRLRRPAPAGQPPASQPPADP